MHLPRHKVQQRNPHANRAGGHRRDASFVTGIEDLRAYVESEIVQAIYVNVDPGQKYIQIACSYPFRKRPDPKARIDPPGILLHDLNFFPADRLQGRTGLAIEVLQAEGVEVRQVKSADAQAR